MAFWVETLVWMAIEVVFRAVSLEIECPSWLDGDGRARGGGKLVAIE